MIIVSQDKKRIMNFNTIDSIYISNNGKSYIYAGTISSDDFNIGEYATEERAKQVLQEIINTFSCNEVSGKLEEIRTRIEFKKISRYEMPQD